jgi:hypothetical protein
MLPTLQPTGTQQLVKTSQSQLKSATILPKTQIGLNPLLQTAHKSLGQVPQQVNDSHHSAYDSPLLIKK